MDGLMFDTESAYSAVHDMMSKKRGKVFTNEVKKKLMGKKTEEVMQLLAHFWETSEPYVDLLLEQDEALVRIYESTVTKMEGLDALLQFLDVHRIRKCIGTSSRRFLVDILLKKFNLTRRFEFIVSGDMIVRGKPDPEVYQRCVASLEVLPSECLVLEDSLSGILSGASVGCFTAAVPTPYTRDEDFLLANVVATSLEDAAIKNLILGGAKDRMTFF